MIKVILLVLSFSPFAVSDYRAYRLEISKNGQKVREVVETLDHLQYPEYYPLQTGEEIAYIESWMCFGRFDEFNQPCPNPKSDSPQVRSPASKP